MASLSTLSVLLLLVLCSSSWFSLSESHRGKAIGVGANQREFDFFLLALQWRGTLCQNTKKCCATNGCCSSNAIPGFTIHGLWTDYNDGSWPQCCNNEEKFDIKEITPLLEGLQKYWPSLKCGSTSTCHGVKGLFWAHEWDASFMRSNDAPYLQISNVHVLGLDTTLLTGIIQKFLFKEILRENGYVPSNTEKYPFGGIVSAIQNAVRATPQIICKSGALKELRVCFYKNFEPRDCVASSSCPKYVSLPEFEPMSLGGTSMSWLTDHEAL